MPDGTPRYDALYDQDILEWSERQVSLLRRLAAGERVNGALDWPNLIEEIETVGRSELQRCESLLVQALVHLLKQHAWPTSLAFGHWQGEIAGFLTDAKRAFAPSMRQRIDLQELYADALYRLSATAGDGSGARDLPAECPFSLADLLAPRPDLAHLAAKLGGD